MTTPTPAGTIEREVVKIVTDIIQAEMVLDDAHCLLGDQPWDIPADKKLFVVVFDDGPVPFGGANFLDTDPASKTVGKEIQQSSVMHNIRIEQMSFDNEARVRKEEPGLALNSFLSQQLQGRYRIQIARAQTPVNASETENTKRLLKYVTHVNVVALHQKIKTPPGAGFYDKFNGAKQDGTIKSPEVQTQP